ncbi:MAG: DinB family protein [Treponema sp.]|nr:DinB family protein [Treponema sp.]
MDKNAFELFVEYNQRVNRQMNDIIKTLSEDEWNKQFPGYFKSIHELCSHIFIWDYTWLYRFKGLNNFKSLCDTYFNKKYDFAETLFKNIDEYLIKRPELDDIFVNFAHEISPDDLDREVKWEDRKGVEASQKFKIMLTHLLTHETHHRGMISLYLELLGKENDYS